LGLLERLCRSFILGPRGFAQCTYYIDQDHVSCMVTEPLGPSLADRVSSCGGKLSLPGTILIAEQVLQLIEYLHSQCLIHRNIKPENLRFGMKDQRDDIYLADFSMSKIYWLQGADGKAQHIPLKKGCRVDGAANYASLHAHKGLEQSRRDDLESIGYMFVYLLKGYLPWSGLDRRARPDISIDIGKVKKATPLSELCKGVPSELREFMSLCRKLGFKERPDYNKLFELLSGCLSTNIQDHLYKWCGGEVDVDADYSPAFSPEPILPRSAITQPDDRPPSRPTTSGSRSSSSRNSSRNSGLGWLNFLRRGSKPARTSKVVASD